MLVLFKRVGSFLYASMHNVMQCMQGSTCYTACSVIARCELSCVVSWYKAHTV